MSASITRQVTMPEQLQSCCVQGLDSLRTMLLSHNTEAQLEAATCLRKLVSVIGCDYQPIVEAGLLPRLVEILAGRTTNVELQREVSWILTNVCCGTSLQASAVVDAGAVPVLVRLINTEDDALRDVCIWALANLAGDGAPLRDVVLKEGALESLLLELNNSSRSLVSSRNAMWALGNLFRSSPPSPHIHLNTISTLILPPLSAALNHEDNEVLSSACWAIAYLLDINRIVQPARLGLDNHQCQNLLSKFVELVQVGSSSAVVLPVLRAMNALLVCATRLQVETLLSTHPTLVSLLNQIQRSGERRSIRKEASDMTIYLLKNCSCLSTTPLKRKSNNNNSSKTLKKKSTMKHYNNKQPSTLLIHNTTKKEEETVTSSSLNVRQMFVKGMLSDRSSRRYLKSLVGDHEILH
jgi:hypothetical protein